MLLSRIFAGSGLMIQVPYGWGTLVPEGWDIRSVVKAWQLAVVTLLAFRVSFPKYSSFTYPDTSV